MTLKQSIKAGRSKALKRPQSLFQLNIPLTIIRRLHQQEIFTLSQLCSHSADELLSIDKIGPKKLILVREALSKLGLSLSTA